MVKDVSKNLFFNYLSSNRERAREKAMSMEAHIGYPAELLDNSKLEGFYKGVSKVSFSSPLTLLVTSDIDPMLILFASLAGNKSR